MPTLLTTAEAAALMGLTAQQFRDRDFPKVFTRFNGRGTGRRRLYDKLEVDEAAQHAATLTAKAAVRRLRKALGRDRITERAAG